LRAGTAWISCSRVHANSTALPFATVSAAGNGAKQTCGVATGDVARTLRHTYCAARLQTLDHGAPVAPNTVSREFGHGSLDMVELYAHLGAVRHRSEVLEYRI
jgi:integrase